VCRSVQCRDPSLVWVVRFVGTLFWRHRSPVRRQGRAPSPSPRRGATTRVVLLSVSPALLPVESRPSRCGARRSPLTRRSALAPLADPSVVDTAEPPAEAAYYGLDNHNRFWVLAFDIDAKDIAVARHADDFDTRPPSEILTNSGVASEPPVQPSAAHDPYHYTFDDIHTAIEHGFELKDYLHDYLEFTNIRIFYSGQGVHVYALDDDKYHRYTAQTRWAISEYIAEKIGLPIDKPVTREPNRLLRIPRSLHAGVSRLVTELESPDFDPRTDDRALPTHLTDTTAPTNP
jgi:hypothetical protein